MNLPRSAKLSIGVNVRAHPKSWLDEDGVNDRLEVVLNQSLVSALLQKKNLLIWDAFSAHLISSVKKKVKSLNSEAAVVPFRLISVLKLWMPI